MNPIQSLTLVLICAIVGSPLAAGESDSTWRSFSLETLRTERAATGQPWHGFLDVDTLTTGLYVLEAGGVDRQTAHARDEVYYIVSGKAVLTIGKEDRLSVKPGSIVFVRAGIDHSFVEIEEALEVIVFFPGARKSDD